MTRAEVRELQDRLNWYGFSHQTIGKPLKVDGIYGDTTRLVHKAWLDKYTAIPTITPNPVEPWWRKKSLLVIVAGLITAGASIAGYELDSTKISEILYAATGLATLILGVVQTVKGEAPVDPTLVARLPARDVRFSGLRKRVALPTERQPDKPWPHGPDSRGNFETE